MGYLFDATGGYEISLLIFAALAIGSLIASFLLVSPQDSLNPIGKQELQN